MNIMMKHVLGIILIAFSFNAFGTEVFATDEQIQLKVDLKSMFDQESLSAEDREKVNQGVRESNYAKSEALYLILLHRLKESWDEISQPNFAQSHWLNNWEMEITTELFSRPDYVDVPILDVLPPMIKDRLPLKDVDVQNIKEIRDAYEKYGLQSIENNRVIRRNAYNILAIRYLDLIVADLCRLDPSPNNDYARERLEPYHLFERQKKILGNEPGAMTWFAWEHLDELEPFITPTPPATPNENHTTKIIALAFILIALLGAWRVRAKRERI